MKNPTKLTGLGLLFLFAALTSPGLAARTNIVLILCDDMGYSDIGCYGGEVRTVATQPI